MELVLFEGGVIMYCSKCGYQLDENDNFCPKCGNKVGSSAGNNVRMIRLKCQDCNGTLEIDEKREIVTCPYCGSKNLIPESDAVKIAKIQTDGYKDVEIAKQQTKREIKKIEQENELKNTRYSYAVWAVGMAILIFMYFLVR